DAGAWRRRWRLAVCRDCPACTATTEVRGQVHGQTCSVKPLIGTASGGGLARLLPCAAWSKIACWVGVGRSAQCPNGCLWRDLRPLGGPLAGSVMEGPATALRDS